jgi:peptidoglycan/xylan/chitin deacetylase (PgdA/CDA1 family)
MDQMTSTYSAAPATAGRLATLAANLEMQALRLAHAKPVMSRLTRPIASFSFDDAPVSAVTTGAAILEQQGLRGTYYLNGANAGQRFEGRDQFSADDVLTLHRAGHEIACHSWGHQRLRRMQATTLEAEFSANLAWARGLLGADFQFDSFAWPYGAYDHATRAIAAQHFTTSRGVYRGVNHGTMDFANLLTVPLEQRRMGQAVLAERIEKALAHNGWIIFFTHDVAEDCTPYGSPPAWLEEAITTVKAAGIEVMTVKDGARAVMGGD